MIWYYIMSLSVNVFQFFSGSLFAFSGSAVFLFCLALLFLVIVSAEKPRSRQQLSRQFWRSALLQTAPEKGSGAVLGSDCQPTRFCIAGFRLSENIYMRVRDKLLLLSENIYVRMTCVKAYPTQDSCMHVLCITHIHIQQTRTGGCIAPLKPMRVAKEKGG